MSEDGGWWYFRGKLSLFHALIKKHTTTRHSFGLKKAWPKKSAVQLNNKANECAAVGEVVEATQKKHDKNAGETVKRMIVD